VKRTTPIIGIIGLALLGSSPAASPPDARSKPTATGHERRIDVVWEPSDAPGADGWNIWRARQAGGPFERLNARPQHHTVCSDFLGSNGATFFYRVSGLSGGAEVSTSAVVSASSRAMTDDQLLTSVQEATFRYFWHYGHPTSGLAREGFEDTDCVTTGGSGFGVMAILVGVERGFVPRSAAAARVLQMLLFLEDKASRYHGAWAHWLNGQTGQTIPFSRFDDGGDLVETSFLVEALLTARQYFNGADSAEREICRRATRLWEAVEWDWYLGEPQGEQLLWHWSPNHAWKMNHRIGGHFNECLITYLLALASPTHPIPASCYTKGWIGRDPAQFVNGNSYFGIVQPVGWPMGGPLFFTHYSFLGFDPRPWRDPCCNYFENNCAISRIHHAYALANPGHHTGYGENVWGLTASRGPDGYNAFQPRDDNGTVAPTAALSAMPYTPRESMAALKHYYHTLGNRLWGDFGFKDAFNLDRNWIERGYLAIDQGPIVVMIENHRSGLCWRLFMANEEIPRALSASGWTRQ
jgi:exo beta-1,2-glucooligosaccharide sophorohydrolase (non-reducing end)